MKAGLGLFLFCVVLAGCGKPARTLNESCEQMFLEHLKSESLQQHVSDGAASDNGQVQRIKETARSEGGRNSQS